MVMDNHLAQRQTKPKVGKMQVAASAGKVRLKDMRQNLRRDANPIVRYHKSDMAFAEGDLDLDEPIALRTVLHEGGAVGNQAGQDNHQLVRVQIEDDVFLWQGVAQPDAALSEHHLKVRKQVLQIAVQAG